MSGYRSLANSGPVNPLGPSGGGGGCGCSGAAMPRLSSGVLGAAGGCLVAAPPVRRQYCTPAAYSSCQGGVKYFKLQEAYGSSRIAQ